MYTWPRSEVLLSSRAGTICQSLIETLYIISRDRWCVESIIQNYFWIQWILLSNIIHFKKNLQPLDYLCINWNSLWQFWTNNGAELFCFEQKIFFWLSNSFSQSISSDWRLFHKKTFHQITFLMRFISWIDFSLRL